MQSDRLKEGLASFVQAQFPANPFLCEYAGRVVLQRGSDSFDFEPDDGRLPSMAGLPWRRGNPGIDVNLDLAASPRALLGFANGDPSKPEIRAWEDPGLQTWSIGAEQTGTITAGASFSAVSPSVNLGSSSPVEQLILGTSRTPAEAAMLGLCLAGFTTLAVAMTAGAAAWTSLAAVGPVPTRPFAAAAATASTAAAAACTAAATGIGTFSGLLVSFLSLVSRTV